MSEYTAENQPLSPDFVPPEQAQPEQQAAPEQEEQWAGPSRDEWEQHQAAIQAVYGTLQQFQQPQPQEQGLQLDPFSENFTQQLDQYISQRVQPYEQMRSEVVLGEATERANDILADIQTQRGDFTDPASSEVAMAMAERYAVEEQARHGEGIQAAEAAILRGYEYAREREEAIAKAAVDRHLNQLKTLGGAPREPGSAGATAVQQHVLPPGGDEMSVVRHYGGYGR